MIKMSEDKQPFEKRKTSDFNMGQADFERQAQILIDINNIWKFVKRNTSAYDDLHTQLDLLWTELANHLSDKQSNEIKELEKEIIQQIQIVMRYEALGSSISIDFNRKLAYYKLRDLLFKKHRLLLKFRDELGVGARFSEMLDQKDKIKQGFDI